MPLDASTLTSGEHQLLNKLVEASQYMERIYWEQADPEALQLYRTIDDPKLRRLLMINGCRFDLIDGNKPFVGSQPIAPGRNLYSQGLTRTEIESYVRTHPSQKDAIYSGYTLVRRRGAVLEAIPYHVAYKEYLKPAAKALEEAASLTTDSSFARFLRLRAKALLTDDYYESDLAWLDLKNPKIDLIFGPYETYLDDILGVKTSYEAAVLIRNEPESRKLALYQKYIPAIQMALPLDAADRPSKEGHLTPMEVMDAPFRAGDLRHGYQAVADNLPNDPRIHQAKGTKKLFFKNFMDARVNSVILPLAQRLMRADQARKVSGEGYLAAVVLHEISHGLGPSWSRENGRQVDIREAIGPVYAALEEAKADVVGMFGLQWLIDHGAVPKAQREEYYASYVAGLFRTIRYGIAEAHGRAEMMEFNFLVSQKAIAHARGRYVIDYNSISDALAELTRRLLVFEARGDRAGAETWFQQHDQMPPALAAALKAVNNLPVDVDPIFDFPELPAR